LELQRASNSFGAVGGIADNLEPLGRAQKRPQTITEYGVVVCDEDA
jgi:hypothetical protein